MHDGLSVESMRAIAFAEANRPAWQRVPTVYDVIYGPRKDPRLPIPPRDLNLSSNFSGNPQEHITGEDQFAKAVSTYLFETGIGRTLPHFQLGSVVPMRVSRAEAPRVSKPIPAPLHLDDKWRRPEWLQGLALGSELFSYRGNPRPLFKRAEEKKVVAEVTEPKTTQHNEDNSGPRKGLGINFSDMKRRAWEESRKKEAIERQKHIQIQAQKQKEKLKVLEKEQAWRLRYESSFKGRLARALGLYP